MKPLFFPSLALVLLSACSSQKGTQNTTRDFYTKDVSKNVFTHIQKLSREEEDIALLGKSFFSKPWVEAPAATTARDGLGPLFSANSCKHCHPNNGAGIALGEKGDAHRSLVMRLSLFSKKNINNDLVLKNGFIPEPNYGSQLSFNGTGDVKYEGSVALSYMKVSGKFADEEPYVLHSPNYKVKNLQYGSLHEDANVAPHIALALVGLGAIDSIDARDILAYEDVNDRDGDGISGKANWVYNPETNKTELGRYTWKAAAATVKQQVANAAHNDMGLSNPLYEGDNCTEFQSECLKAPKSRGDVFDLPMKRVDAIALYLKSLKIPLQRESENFAQGREVFHELGCVKCHVESYKSEKYGVFNPYSDFLLHDMGESLSDGHTMFQAQESEFRTPPLWGMGLYKRVSGELNLLHDGRAKSISEAILWHGGEAEAQKVAYIELPKRKRETLIEFLKGI
ncbi:MAG: thiol oxidoreductase [Campylobacterales bacterium]|nr:thiol oxidoreductase [Campylobacterales bacterium]